MWELACAPMTRYPSSAKESMTRRPLLYERGNRSLAHPSHAWSGWLFEAMRYRDVREEAKDIGIVPATPPCQPPSPMIKADMKDCRLRRRGHTSASYKITCPFALSLGGCVT